MNLIECVVTEVKSTPYCIHDMWCFDVVANSWGSALLTVVYCQTEEEANTIDVGFTFDA